MKAGIIPTLVTWFIYPTMFLTWGRVTHSNVFECDDVCTYHSMRLPREFFANTTNECEMDNCSTEDCYTL